MEQRLQKLIAAAGLCSRRRAEEWLEAGRVTVNGRAARVGDKADPERDDVRLDGTPLQRQARSVCILLNKPRGYVTTLSDERGRPTVAELVRGVPERVYPVGRLDMDSEGLLLLTNDGALTQRLLHPSFRIDKTYEVDVSGFQPDSAAVLSAVRELDGEPVSPAQVTVLSRSGERARLSVVIHEGKNRQIRRMCAQCGLTVRRLRRVQEHTLTLGSLPPGKWRYLTREELDALSGE
ncbi:pseudouridine synthase [uncultured Oscillibacter sp.]|uniref:pseudouridine synthase n=1 Tax=uncultured Oscillibacter sp. TaxID=876091 RepID=UPI0025F26EB7|nr:pseudouridine synthase [uncultured Oscillibacter sp.]